YADPEIVQTGDLRLRELLIADISKRRAAPQAEGRPQVPGCTVRLVGGERPAAVRCESLEPPDVDLFCRGHEQVGAWPGQNGLRPGGGLKRLPEPRDVDLERVLGPGRGALAPHPVDQDIARH